MKNYITLFMFLSILSCAPSNIQQKSTFEGINISRLTSNTVAFVAVDADGDTVSFCTGTWISEKTILTASHCVEAYGRAMNNVDDNTPYDPSGDPIAFIVKEDVNISVYMTPVERFRFAHVTVADIDNDVALVEVFEGFVPKHTKMNTNCDPVLEIGTQVHSVSNMQGLTWSYTKGYISAVRKQPFAGKIRDYVQIAFDGEHGSSGSAAYDDNGCMIGVITTMTNNRMMFSVDPLTVRHVLQGVKE